MMRALIAFLLVLPAAAADLEGWFTVEGPVFVWSRTELNFHSQLRLRESPGNVGYGRVGAVSRTSVHPHLNVVGGYYFEEGHFDYVEWLGNHRVFGGGELPFRWGRWRAQGRVNLERFIGLDHGGYTRVRERIQFDWVGPLNPYGSCEWLQDVNGLQFTRVRGGVSFQAMPRATLGFSYSYDAGTARWGRSRQFILTTLEWEKRP